jgi:hypothetical protein
LPRSCSSWDSASRGILLFSNQHWINHWGLILIAHWKTTISPYLQNLN